MLDVYIRHIAYATLLDMYLYLGTVEHHMILTSQHMFLIGTKIHHQGTISSNDSEFNMRRLYIDRTIRDSLLGRSTVTSYLSLV